MDREEEIRLLAYLLWEDEGRPSGRDVAHWVRAEALWEERHRPLTSGPHTTPVMERTPAPPQRTRRPRR